MHKELNEPVGNGSQQNVVAIFDLDRTMTRIDTFLPFLFIALRGRPYRIFFAWLLPFAFLVFKLGLRNNGWLKQVFLRAIAGGATRFEIETWSQQLLRDLWHSGINLQARQQLEHHRQSGHLTILISASYDFYVSQLGETMGFDTVICTEAAWTGDSRLSGTAPSGNCYGPVKLQRLQEQFPESRQHRRVVVYSDHHSDLTLLEWADEAVVVNPGRKARIMAQQRNFEVRHWS